MNRRSLLSMLAFGSTWPFLSCASRQVSNEQITPTLLRQDLVNLSKRNYVEQGIPVFLICEDIAHQNHTKTASREGRDLSLKFRRLSAMFSRIRPDATDADIPKVIELLAEQDFGTSATRDTK